MMVQFDIDASDMKVIVADGTVELPVWMTTYMPSKFSHRIIAVGREPKSEDVVFVTSEGEVRELERADVPRGTVDIANHGKLLSFDDAGELTYVTAQWATSKSILLVAA